MINVEKAKKYFTTISFPANIILDGKIQKSKNSFGMFSMTNFIIEMEKSNK